MLHGSMLYDVSGGHFTSHIVVLDVEHPRKKSESTSYLTQLSKAKADRYISQESIIIASLLNRARDSASQDKLFLINNNKKRF